MRWLAIGPGRCGTKSLAHAFADQDATHESIRLPWDLTVQGRAAAALRIVQDEPEVSFMFTRWWETARAMDPDLPIICMHRSKFDVVASHLRICHGRDRLADPPTMLGDFNHAYPKVKNLPAYMAWGLWWDMAEGLMKQVDNPVWHMKIEDLNDNYAMEAIRNWLRDEGRIV